MRNDDARFVCRQKEIEGVRRTYRHVRHFSRRESVRSSVYL